MDEELKKLLGEVLAKEVESKIGDKKVFLNDGTNYVPKARLNEEIEKTKAVETKLAQTEGAVTERDKSIQEMQKNIKGLKDSAGDNEELKTKIKALEDQGTEMATKHKERERELLVTSEISKALLSSEVDPAYSDYLAERLDRSRITVADDGHTVSGVSDQIPDIVKKYPKFFGKDNSVGTNFKKGGDDQNGEFLTLDQIDAYDQKTLVDDPALLKKVNKSLEHHGSTK